MEEPTLFKTQMFANVRKLINVIDELRDYGLGEQISLPRIAVLGTQSSGKSSLLENVVGLDFLPRGSGVVTRRPLELRMVHVDKRRKERPYAVFDVDKQRKYYNFDEVCKRIVEETDKVAGVNKNIVDDPIKLTICSSDCPDLTIIDLPGITRIDISGQKDVYKVTTEMAAHYCKDERTIILCVIPANSDLSTSDGLRFAREWDKNGERTIGVITKIDIMDQGTNARKMLLNEEIPLRLGYIGIKNRAQEDINNKVPVEKSLEDERKYFESHPEYKDLPSEVLGTKSLTTKLSNILMTHIGRCMPAIIREISQKVDALEERLKDLGTALPTNSKERVNFLMNMINDFTSSFRNAISGRFVANSRAVGAGAKIKEDFRKIYEQFIQPDYKCSVGYTDKQIQNAILIHQGDQIDGFPSMDSFLFLMIPQIEKLKLPAYETLEAIYLSLSELALDLNKKIFARFPQVLSLVSEVTNRRLLEQKDKTTVIIDNLLNAEIAVIFTNDENYLSARNDLLAVHAQLIQKSTSTDPQKLFIDEIRDRLDAYFRIVVRALNDSIPKAIGFFLVKQSQEQLQMLLYNDVISREAIIETLGEPKEVQQERESLLKQIDVLKKSIKRIKKDPDFAPLLKSLEDDD